MSSSWSEIRSRAGNDPLIDVIADLQTKANLNEAIENIPTTDKISPIRILRSKVEVYDSGMMTGYVRPKQDKRYYMPVEPDGNHLRLQVKFDSGCDTLPDYSLKNNVVNIRYNDTLPVLLKGTEDDGITAGDMVSVIDGKTQYYRVKVTDPISIKKMVTDGKPGVTIIYRNFPLLIENEDNSNNTQRATPFYFIENDQLEYACKAQIDDAGYIYFFFRYQFVNYYVRSTVAHITRPEIADYFEENYDPEAYYAAADYYTQPFPTPYIDLGFQFNFASKAISLFINGVRISVTTTSVNLVPPLPAPIFPPAFADPPPPPELPEPYFHPFQKVYEHYSTTNAVQINARTTTFQRGIYYIPGTPAKTDEIVTIFQVKPPPPGTVPPIIDTGGGGGGGGTGTPLTELGGITSSNESRLVLQKSSGSNRVGAIVILDNKSGLGQKLVGKVINKCRFILKGDSSPTGMGRCKQWSSNGTVKVDFGEFDAARIDQSAWETESFENFSNTVPVEVGDRIGIEYTSGSSSDIIYMRRRSTNLEDSSVRQSTINHGDDMNEWQQNNSYQVACMFWTGGSAATDAGEEDETETPTATTIVELGGIDTGENGYTLFKKDNAKKMAVQIDNSDSGLGQKLFNKVITEVTFWMSGDSTPTGPVYFRQWDNDGNIKVTFGEKDSATLMQTSSATFAPVVISKPDNTTPVALGDRIGVEWVSATGSTNDLLKLQGYWIPNGTPDNSILGQDVDTSAGDNDWQTDPNVYPRCLFKGFAPAGTGEGEGPVVTTAPVYPLNNEVCGVKALVGQRIADTSPVVNTVPTLIELMIWRNAATTAGTYTIAQYDMNAKLKQVFFTGSVASLPDTTPTDYNIVWQDVNNKLSIQPYDTIAVEVIGVTGAARVYVMTNKDFRGELKGALEIPNPVTEPIVATPTFPTPPSDFMKHYGGDTQSGGTCHIIFWGKDWNTRESPWSKADMVGAMQTVFQSKFFDGMIQYGIKRPHLGTMATNVTYPDYNNFSRVDMQNMIKDSIEKGIVPPPSADNNTSYHIIPRRNQTPHPDVGDGNWGYHTWFRRGGETIESTKHPGEKVYIVFSYQKHRDFAGTCGTLTHEIEEAITDPYINWDRMGVYAKITREQWEINHAKGYFQEIADVCGDDPDFQGVYVNKWYNNQENGCNNPNTSPTWISCQAGATYNEVTQQCEGESAGTIKVGGFFDNDHDGVASHIVSQFNGVQFFNPGESTVDLVMRVRKGGGEFTGYIELDNRRKRAGIKVNQNGSLLLHKVITKMDFKVRRFGTLPPSLLHCVIRDQMGNLKLHMGSIDASTIMLTDTPIQFINSQHTYALGLGDVISLEYDAGTTTAYVMVRIAQGFFNEGDANKTMLFEGILPYPNLPFTLHDKDMAATLYTGGRTDLMARPMRGVKVMNEQSVLFGKVITEVRVRLRATGSLPLGSMIRVKILRGTDRVNMKTMANLDFNSISTTSFNEYYFQNTNNTYVMKVGDMVGVEFNAGNGTNNFIEMRTSLNDTYDGQNTIMFEYNGLTYLEVPNRDLSGSMSIGGYTVYPDPAVPTPTPPFHYAHEWFIGAAAPPDSQALVDPEELNPPENSHFNTIGKEFRIYDELLTERQLANYYENRFTITPVTKGSVEIVGHDVA